MNASFAEGQLVFVTGSTDGIGKEAARELLDAGARVILHGRDPEKLAYVEDELQRETRRKAAGALVADFSSLDAVRKLAFELGRRFGQLRILVNNAGIYLPERHVTQDGFEQTLQVQYLAPFLLTTELLALLRKNVPARVVNVTSRLHLRAELDLALHGPLPYEGGAAYASSKLLLVLFTLELADRLKGTGIMVNAVHPGGVDTKLLRVGYGGGGLPVEAGAKPIVRLAASPTLAMVTGRYFERLTEADPDPRAYDRATRKALWDRTEKALRRKRRAA